MFVEIMSDVTDFTEFDLAFAFVERDIPFPRSFQHLSQPVVVLSFGFSPYEYRSSTSTLTPSISSNFSDMMA